MRTEDERHGMAYTREYQTWQAMKQRCYYPKANGYKDYGGRGVRVCEAWKKSFRQFFQDMGDRPDGCSLDRIDTDGDYSPSNCRWSTGSEQQLNKRYARPVTKIVCRRGHYKLGSNKYLYYSKQGHLNLQCRECALLRSKGE